MIDITIDASDLQDKLARLRTNMSDSSFNTAMYGILRRTSTKVKKILKSDIPNDYYATPSAIGAAVKSPRIAGAGFSMNCTIPISAPRGSIGGKSRSGGGFSASGGAHGWNSIKRKYRVKSRIVKDGTSTLPSAARSYGGKPPFRNLSAKSLNGLTFTRAGKERFPIMKVMGISIAQMPANRTREQIENELMKELETQVDKRFMALMRIGI